MFDKLKTEETSHTLGKINNRSKRLTNRRKKIKFLVEKGNNKLTTDEIPENETNDLQEK